MLTHIVHTNNSHWSMDQAEADLEEGVANLLAARRGQWTLGHHVQGPQVGLVVLGADIVETYRL